jgi:anaerobic magnesium-protoporphyrin IX monomethyl ester cyclase
MIVLYNPESSANRKPVLPMSLLAVGAVLEGKYAYRIVDGNLEDDPLAALEQVIRNAREDRPGEPPLLAVTVMPGPQLEQAVPLCRRLKQRHPDLIVVWGGYFPTQHWDACLRAPYVDFVIRGHGEYAFLRLLESLAGADWRPDGASLSSLPGLAYRDADGRPVTNALAPIPPPRQLPPWNFDRVPVERYVRQTFLGRRTLGYHSSYGCPFFCNFCAVVNMVNGRWLPQSSEQVAAIAHLYRQRWGVDAIEFYDNNFFTQEARVAEFSERVLDLGIAWWGEGRIDTLEKYGDRTWRLMRDSGLRMIFMGAESGSMTTLKRMRKGGQMSPDKTLAMARRMREWGIVPEFSFVMGNPPDPETDVRETMGFIRKVKQVNPAAEVIMYLYTPVPLGGDLYDDARAGGFAFPETLEEWVSPDWADFSQRRSNRLPWLSQPLREQIRDFERVLNAYYPTSTDARLVSRWRWLLRSAAAWRYHSGFYRFPLELQALQRVLSYQRPETSGF